MPEAGRARAIGPMTVDHLTRQTGVDRFEIGAPAARAALGRYATDGRRFA
ncbi:hypothetical protein FOHLNKBM_5960 [Methylobacterium longum]|nr:hypothetical protein FOHLNKBM_5960 [Methylobacterium longum]